MRMQHPAVDGFALLSPGDGKGGEGSKATGSFPSALIRLPVPFWGGFLPITPKQSLAANRNPVPIGKPVVHLTSVTLVLCCYGRARVSARLVSMGSKPKN